MFILAISAIVIGVLCGLMAVNRIGPSGNIWWITKVILAPLFVTMLGAMCFGVDPGTGFFAGIGAVFMAFNMHLAPVRDRVGR